MFAFNRSKACLQRFVPANWEVTLKNLLNLAVFAVGLAAVCWIGAGYIGSNPLGAAVAMLIGACYLAGAWELHRYRQATDSLTRALGDATTDSLTHWLERLHPSLRHSVRLRIEGDRVALPAPALTPYLVGLLVLLGMLGTLLGMMATLRGTGLALESATDLAAIRGSLAAPVTGLGFAFGTSIAGVATSAMLGLLSALVRRERLHAVHRLDAKIATSLRVHSQAYQREESFKLLQQQTELMPTLVERLQSMMAALEQQGAATGERQLAGQQAFHAKTEAAYTQLATSVGQALKDSVAEGARASGALLQPVVEATMAGLARETASLREAVSQSVQQHLDGLSSGFEQSTASIAGIWTRSLAEQRDANDTLVRDLKAALEQFGQTFEQRSNGMVDGMTARMDEALAHASGAWSDALAQQSAANEALASHNQQALASAAATFEEKASALVSAADQSHANLQAALEQRDEARLAAWTESFGSMAASLSHQWEQAGEHATKQQQAICDTLTQTARDITAQSQAHAAETIAEITKLTQTASDAPKAAAELMRTVHTSHAELQATLEARDEARLTAWTDSLNTMATSLSQQWEQAGEHATRQQKDICDTLAQTARDITAQAQAHAGETIAEISRLMQAAAEAPKVAAEVVAELRQKLSDSMVRDTAMLEERSRLLATLETLLDAVNHASTEQRTAVDALVATSADLLDRVSTRFTDHIEAETGKLTDVAAQLTGSAVEVASLGEAFGAAVHAYGQSNDALMERLQHVAEALDRSLVRSDEQLAYYVAQAKEVVDLSVLSQKQIIEDLQLIAGQRAAGVEPA